MKLNILHCFAMILMLGYACFFCYDKASAETKKIGNFKYEYDSAPNGCMDYANYTGYRQ